MQRNKQGFTLIELIVVIAILAILAVALIPLINNFIEKSRISRIMTTASTLETAAVAYNADVASFPDEDAGGINAGKNFEESDLQLDPSKANWDGPYLNRNTEGVSPWGSSLSVIRFAMNGIGNQDEEYVLEVEDSDNANVPGASINEIDKKIDGSANGNSGKVQGQDGDGEFLMAIISDAFLASQAPA